ncbi:AIPR family protein [Leptolyngbya sp. PL-A3]|uniref:AIPR family protein n=1 Tax=Leptolyngbya sp. PL-A3 TaxID=2933911 RepID=UPI003297801E
MFEAHICLNDIGLNDQERDSKVLTRCLAALAIYIQADCSEEDAGAAVWDGSDDDGIDAAYFDSSTARVILVQSKWIQKGTGEPAANEIGVFAKGVKDLIENNLANFADRLNGQLKDISLQLLTPGTKVHLVLISTGASSIAVHGQSVITQLLNELNIDESDPIASFEVMGLAEVYSGLANDRQQGNVNLDAHIRDWTYIHAPFPAYFGIIDGLQLKNWLKQYGKRLFTANIRYSLGATDVNDQIQQTATNNPENFWYFNNGITLVAHEAPRAPAGGASHDIGIFSLNSASVVNGAQTISSLAMVENDANLSHVRVLIRVILLSTTPPDFGNDVTRANNLQNRIESRDFVAHDPEQRRIREEMKMGGVEYEFLRSENVSSTETSCELIEVMTALACASGDPSLVVQIKAGTGRFFADLSKPPYKTLFNPSTSGVKAFNATVVCRAVDNWIDRKKKSFTKQQQHGFSWGVLVHGNRMLAAAVFKEIDANQLSQPIEQFSKSLQQASIDVICEDVYNKMLAMLQKYYENNVLGSLFKNLAKSKHVFDLITQKVMNKDDNATIKG